MSPCSALREFVRAFECINVLPTDAGCIRAIWAYPHVMVPFSIGSSFDTFEYRTGLTMRLPEAIVVGTTTHRVADMLVTGHHRVFNVIFQPGGLFRLFGVRGGLLADQAVEAPQLLGPLARELGERLRTANSMSELVGLAERALLPKLAEARPADPVHRAALQQLEAHGTLPISALIAASGLGTRQFERRFVEQFGVSPKRYARITRLDYALRLKNRDRRLSWAVVGQLAGYFDQNHLIKDFKSMTGLLPSLFAQQADADDAMPLTSWPFPGRDLAYSGLRNSY